MATSTTVKRAFKFRFYPTPEQEQELVRTWGCVRAVYNKALDMRHTGWYQHQQRVTFAETSRALTQWKKQDELSFLSEVSSVPLQQCLRHLQTAFTNFFEKRAGYPKFKSLKKSRLGLTYSRAGFSFKDGELHLAKMKQPLSVRWSREFDKDATSTVTVSRDNAGRWFVSCLSEVEVPRRKVTGKTVGIDLGVGDTLVLSTGEKLSPRDNMDMKRKQDRVKRRQRKLSKLTPGSNNFAKAKLKLGKAHEAVTDARKDWVHKVTTRLVTEYDVICIEDLNVRGMTRSAKGTAEKPGKNVRQKAGLNRVILEQSFAEIRRCLEYKAEDCGGVVVAIDRFFPSSKTCSTCSSINRELSLSQRHWTCSCCGAHHDRDVNAALNIKAAGLAVYACGDGIRPAKKPLASESGSRR